MFRSYRLLGITALLSLIGLAGFQSSYAQSSQSIPEQGPNPGKYNSSSIAPAIDRVVKELAETRKDQSDPHGDERNKREKRDIVAQEESAKWARWNFFAIVAQTLLAGGALAAILSDIKQNRKSSEAQLRAYLSFDELVWNEAKKDYKPLLIWRNNGQTPANAVQAYATWIELDHPLPDNFDFSQPDIDIEDGPTSVGAGQTVLGTCQQDLTSRSISNAALGMTHIYVWGRADYRDVFNKKRFSEIAVKMQASFLPNNTTVIRWITVHRHNQCT